jgi:uncharacterized protein (DUF2236 family)
MLALLFGDQHEAEGAIEGIRKIHRRVQGTLKADVGQFPAGTRYSAEDPALLRWVHLTLIDSVISLYEKVIGPLSEAERDSYCTDAAWVPVALGARESEIPRTWADVRRAFDDVIASGVLAVGDDAKAIAEAVLTPPLPSAVRWMLRPVSTLQRHVTMGTLPPEIRAQYGWKPPAPKDLERTFARLRVFRRVLPKAIAWWPDARQSRGRRQPIAARAESPSR